ncbi:MAG TPA: antitermination protein NusG, partial [Thermoanaerobaculia bacterium]
MPILKREVDLSPSHLFELSTMEHPWWVAYVRSRQEKGLARHLAGHGVGFYLPQAEKRTRRAGRTFVSSLP